MRPKQFAVLPTIGPPHEQPVHRDLNADLPRIVSPKANYLIDDTGKRYLETPCWRGCGVLPWPMITPPFGPPIKAQVDTLAFAPYRGL